MYAAEQTLGSPGLCVGASGFGAILFGALASDRSGNSFACDALRACTRLHAETRDKVWHMHMHMHTGCLCRQFRSAVPQLPLTLP